MGRDDRLNLITALRLAGVIGAMVAAMAVPGTVGAASNDSDGDGLTNSFETNRSHTNPYRADTDRDGMPNQWERDNQLLPNDPTDAGADADVDGQTNLQEYQAGTNPRDPASLLRITGVEMTEFEVRVRFQVVSGHSYRLERTDDMITWTKVIDTVAGSVAEMEVVDKIALNPQSRFYRILLLP